MSAFVVRRSRRFMIGALAIAASGFARRARAAQFEFKAAANFGPEHPIVVRSTQMWKTIERESDGRISIRYFPNAVLGTDAATLSQLRVGAIQFMTVGPGILQAIVPSIDITNLGFAFKDASQALYVMDGPLGDYIRREIAAKGLYLFRSMWDSGMREITSSSHPILRPDDLHGFKIRVNASKIMLDLFRALGASPAPLNFSEMYTSLQTKLVDGNDSPLSSIASSRLYEVQKYVSMTNHTWSGLCMISSADAVNRLPPDLLAVVERNSVKYASLERRDTALYNASVMDKLKRLGIAFNTVDQQPFRAQLSAYFRTWAAAFGATEWGLLESSLGTKLG